MDSSPENLTQLLNAWQNGETSALDELTPLIYGELRRLAGHYLNQERKNHTLQPTALVNEVWLKLKQHESDSWQNRTHFFAVTARIMRHLLVDYARSRDCEKRGGQTQQIQLEDVTDLVPEQSLEIIGLHQALEKLSAIDERKSRIVELRYFGGLSAEETAEVLEVSVITIKREWLKAKAWLYRELNGSSLKSR